MILQRRALFRLSAAAAGVFPASHAFAQFGVAGLWPGIGTGRAFDADVLAWESAVIGAGGGVTLSRRIAVDQLVFSLKSDGIWTILDRLWLFAAESSAQALIDLKALATATAVNSPSFQVDRGYTGNGTSSYLDSGFNAATAGGQFTRNDAGMGAWVVTAPGANGGAEIGNNDSAYSWISARNGTTSCGYAVNLAAGPVTGVANGGATGLWHARRTTASAMALFKNGVALDAQAAATSTTLAAATHKVLCVPNGADNAFGKFSTAQVGAAFIGASLSGKEAALYAALRTYMTTLGVS